MAKTIAVDFDNTIHPYKRGWIGPVPDDEPPFAGAEKFILGLIEDGYHVAIMSTRCNTPRGERGIIEWLFRYMHPVYQEISRGNVSLTCEKVPAIAYVDDRAITFRGDFEAVRGEIDQLVQHGPLGGHRENR